MEIIGKGSFGNIYKATNIKTGRLVALKMESLEAETKLLKNETKIYQYLSGIEGIPGVLWFGVDKTNYYMAITLLGSSLQNLREEASHISLEIAKTIAIKIVKILQGVHKKGLIHRDVKPDNFMFGLDDKKHVLHLIDFGLCKKYILDDEFTHIPMRENRKLLGTPNFVSINVHDGIEPSRRDDLESVTYIMLYLLYKHLEWDAFTLYSDYRNMNNKIRGEKIKIMTNENTPRVIREMFEYCRKLKFDEKPNYDYIIDLLNTR